MNHTQLVERITDHVLEALRKEGAGASHSFTQCTPCTNSGHCLRKRHDVVQVLHANGAARISAAPGVRSVRPTLAAHIDHTLLKPEATRHQVAQLCLEAKQHGFASCCVNPYYVPLAAKLLRGTKVKVCTVVGFPLGATSPAAKSYETKRAIEEGAHEIDMVMNIGAAKSGDFKVVENDIRGVADAAAGGALVKVIIETALLTDDEKVRACRAARLAGADYVKTSTGFSKGGATIEDILLMRQTVGQEMGVKASGGVGDTETARRMIEAGASRIGASASVKIVTDERSAAA
ncbi:MAG: deoxyribose-phosphate aldolase [Gemmatimonadetes bacterium]|nr:deoxyribose-phosphate aldolase [Gemmatimonadota bacterium]